MKNRWLYIITAVMVVMLILSLFNMYNKTLRRILVDREVVPGDGGRFIRTTGFVGVQRSNIIFECTEKGE